MRAIHKLMIGSAVSSCGIGLFHACALVFFVTRVGLPVKVIGITLSIGALMGIFLATPVGKLTDKKGVTNIFSKVLFLRALAYSGLSFSSTIYSYIVFALLAETGDFLNPSLNQTLIGQLISDTERTKAMGLLKSLKNIAITIGLLLGAIALKFGSDRLIRSMLLANGLSFLILARIVSSLPNLIAARRTSNKDRTDLSKASTKAPLKNPWLLTLAGINGVLLLYDATMMVLFPLWLLRYTHLDKSFIPLFFMVNAVLTVGLQLWLPRTRAGMSWKSGVALGILAYLIATLSFFIAQQSSFNYCLVATCVAVGALAFAESLCGIASWNISYEIAGQKQHKDRFAEYISVFNLSYAINTLIGPVLMSHIILPVMPYGWLALGALFCCAGILVLFIGNYLTTSWR